MDDHAMILPCRWECSCQIVADVKMWFMGSGTMGSPGCLIGDRKTTHWCLIIVTEALDLGSTGGCYLPSLFLWFLGQMAGPCASFPEQWARAKSKQQQNRSIETVQIKAINNCKAVVWGLRNDLMLQSTKNALFACGTSHTWLLLKACNKEWDNYAVS